MLHNVILIKYVDYYVYIIHTYLLFLQYTLLKSNINGKIDIFLYLQKKITIFQFLIFFNFIN